MARENSPERPEARDLLRSAVALLSALFMVGANAAVVRQQVSVSTEAANGSISPAVYAFGIWGVIFLLVVGYGVYTVLPGNPARDLGRRTSYPASAAFLCAGLWPIATGNRQSNVAQVLIVLMWIALAVTYLRIIRVRSMSSAERWLAGITFGLFFGWVTAANAVSLQSSVATWGATEQVVNIAGLGALIVAGALAAWFIRQGLRGPVQLWAAYAAAITWALVAIIIRQAGAAPEGVIAAVIAAIPAAIVVVSGMKGAGQAMPAGRSA
jgi:hypothetical protein